MTSGVIFLLWTWRSKELELQFINLDAISRFAEHAYLPDTISYCTESI
jgi:hypothetical protein